MPKPNHRQALEAWSKVTSDAGEACVLILPQPKAILCTAFRPDEVHGMFDHLSTTIKALKVGGMVTTECPWTALIAPSFVFDHAPDEDVHLKHGDLQRAYVEGDMNVREVILVVIMEMDGPAIGQSFSQPLLEPLDDPIVVAGGEIEAGLAAVMVACGLPED